MPHRGRQLPRLEEERVVRVEVAGDPVSQLEAVARDDAFWFVWFAFRSETRIAQ